MLLPALRSDRLHELHGSQDYKVAIIEGTSVGSMQCRHGLHPIYSLFNLAAHSCADTSSSSIVATASLIIERKFIRGCGKV